MVKASAARECTYALRRLLVWTGLTYIYIALLVLIDYAVHFALDRLRPELQRSVAAAGGLQRGEHVDLSVSVIFVPPGIAEIDHVFTDNVHDLRIFQVGIDRADQSRQGRHMRAGHRGAG